MSVAVSPSFFVPGTAPSSREAENRYDELRAAAATPEGVAPDQRRIFSVGCRFAGRDCVIEVGGPSPHDGEEVLAIFELGSRGGYAVATSSGGRSLQLGRHVYWITDFARA